MFEYTDLLAKELSKAFEKHAKTIKDVSEENGTFKVIASTEAVDRHGEVVKASGRNLDNYMKNPIILFGHDYRNVNSIVGKATKVYVEKNQLIVEGVFAGTESAQVIRKLYDEGIIKAVSVGFIPLDRDQKNPSIITEAELLELSFVPVPANQEALSLDGKMLAKAIEIGIVSKGDEPESPGSDEPNTIETPESVEEEKEPTNKDIAEMLKSLDQKVDKIFNHIEKSMETSSGKSDADEDKDQKLQKANEELKKIAGLVGKALHEIKL